MGHAVRAAAVLDRLARILPLELTVMAACDRRAWPGSLAAATRSWHCEPCDVGVVQSDDVTVDLDATARRLEGWLRELPGIVQREARRLEGSFDLVLGDVPSAAFAAAKTAQIPCVAVANFSWDWIYAELGFEEAAVAAAEGYAQADLLLEAAPSGPMAAFGRRREVGLIARAPAASRRLARAALRLQGDTRVALMAFQPSSAPALALPPEREGRIFLVPPGWPDTTSRRDLVEVPAGAGFEDALAAADVVVGKPGYGLIGDVEASGSRFLYVPRPGFPENAVLVHHLSGRAATAALAAGRLARGEWEDDLVALEEARAPAAARADGAQRAAEEIAALLEVDSREQPQ
ncbi:MAG: hypothetical protein ABR538_18030 [Candidatus Binatia bacterium]